MPNSFKIRPIPNIISPTPADFILNERPFLFTDSS